MVRFSDVLPAVIAAASVFAAGELAAQDPGLLGIEGVAVTVESANGTVQPAVFIGSRIEADSASDGSFHFPHDTKDDLHVMPLGSRWAVQEEGHARSQDIRVGLAVLLRRDDGSWSPAVFLGPMRLARQLGEILGEGGPLVVPEGPTRVHPVAPGSEVRVIVGGATADSRPPVPPLTDAMSRLAAGTATALRPTRLAPKNLPERIRRGEP